MSLAEQQRRFQAAIVADESPVLRDVAPGARRGVPVYRHAYRATLRAALADTFERTYAWLGDDLFDTAAQRYIAATPSRSWTLAAYGHGFATLLAALHPDDPEIAELAWLDWTLRRAFDAADAPQLDLAGLAGIDWDEAVLLFHPSLAVGAAVTNSLAIWNAIGEGATPPAVALLEQPTAVRVWRQSMAPTFRSISPNEASALTNALAGAPFGTICAEVAADGEAMAAARAGAMLSDWIRDDILIGVNNPACTRPTSGEK